MSGRFLPDTSHPDFAPFWRGCAERRLVMPRCEKEHIIWPPRPACPSCSELVKDWVDVPGVGRLYSWTVVRRTRLHWYSEHTPYVVGIVNLDHRQLLRMVGRCDVEPDKVAEGMTLAVDFEDAGRQIAVPFWRPVQATAGTEDGS